MCEVNTDVEDDHLINGHWQMLVPQNVRVVIIINVNVDTDLTWPAPIRADVFICG